MPSLGETPRRCWALSTIEVEYWYPVGVIVFVKMRKSAAQYDWAHLCQLDQQTVVAWRMPGGVEYDPGDIVKHILVL